MVKVSPKKEHQPNTLQSIKSMHVNQRKNELDRIEKENRKIASKIYLTESILKQQPEFVKKHLYMSDNLSKIKRRKVFQIGDKTLHLPPI